MSLIKNPNKRKRQDQLYKLLRKDLKHHDFQYITTGPNILTTPFDSSTNQGPGALYACYLEDVVKWLNLHDDLTFVYEVTLLEDSQLVECTDKIRTDKLLLSNPKTISNFLFENNLEVKAIIRDSNNLKYITNQTEALCHIALNKNIHSFELIKQEYQTKNLCMTYFAIFPEIIKYIKNFTFDYYLEITKYSSTNFNLIKEPTQEMCVDLVKRYPSSFKTYYTIFKNITEEMLLYAIQDYNNMYYIEEKFKTPKLCLAAVQIEGLAIQFIKDKTPELWQEAIYNNGNCIRDYLGKDVYEYKIGTKILTQTDLDLIICAIHSTGMAIQFLTKEQQTHKLCRLALDREPNNIQYIKDQTPELCEYAIKQDALSLQYVLLENQTLKLCKQAIMQNIKSIVHIKKFTKELFLFAVNYDVEASVYFSCISK